MIRPFTLGDLTQVHKLIAELGYKASLEETTERFSELTNLPQHGLFVLDNNGVKGWIHLEKIFNLIMPIKVQIKALVVDENERSKGYGRELLEFAALWTKDSGVSTIYLSTNITRDRAQAFYLKTGFTKVKTSHFFEMNI